jgi:hypothetical protein
MAQELARGADNQDAARVAGYKVTTANASRVANLPIVRARVAELLNKRADKALDVPHKVTVNKIIQQLEEDRLLAHRVEQSGAAVAASMGAAKVAGLLVDNVKHSGNVTVRLGPEDQELL